jgi:hypothetical protein
VPRTFSPYTNATPLGGRRRGAPRPLSLVPFDDAAARAEAAVGAATLLRDLDALVAAGMIVPELVDGEVRYAVAPDAPEPEAEPDEAA